MASISQMIDDCNEVKDIPESSGGPGFNDWELEFLDSVEDQYAKKGKLTETQIEKLEELWDKI